MAAPSVPVSFNYDQKTIRVAELGAALSRSYRAGATAMDPTQPEPGHTHTVALSLKTSAPLHQEQYHALRS